MDFLVLEPGCTLIISARILEYFVIFQISSEMSQIPPDVANGMSLFFAHSTPMMNKLSETTSNFAKDAFSTTTVASNATEMLSVMAKVSIW